MPTTQTTPKTQTQTVVRRESFASGVKLRENADGSPSRVIEGYAIVFNRASEPLVDYPDYELREVIAPEAVTDDLLAASDIKMTMFHNRELLLARSNKGTGSLTYERDEHGVKFSFEAPHTAEGDKALEAVKRGDIAGCSFAFGAYYDSPQGVEITRTHDDDGKTHVTATVREIVAIYDFTLAADPAYPDTSVNLRELTEGEEAPAQEETPAQGEEPTQEETPAQGEEPTQEETPATDGADEAENPENNINPINPTEMPEIKAPKSNGTPAVKREAKTLTEIVREGLHKNPRSFTIEISEREVAASTTPSADGSGGDSGSSTTGTPAVINTTGVTPSGLIPITVKEIIEEVDKGIVYNKIGMPLSHNNAGEFLWPTYSAGEAKIVGEGESIAASEITFGKLTARPERFAVRFDLTYESIDQTRGVVENIVNKALALAMQRAINRVILSPTKVTGARDIVGPFVGLTAITIPKALTFKDINKLKGKLLSANCEIVNPVVVMHPVTKCDLEATPKDAGSGIMLVENDRLCGYPIFTSQYVAEGTICMGDFGYQPSGFFGPVRLTVDPYTSADANMVRFILNIGFATKTLRPEAFVIGKIATA